MATMEKVGWNYYYVAQKVRKTHNLNSQNSFSSIFVLIVYPEAFDDELDQKLSKLVTRFFPLIFLINL